MSTALTLGAYAGGLAVAFAAAFTVGATADPLTDPTPTNAAHQARVGDAEENPVNRDGAHTAHPDTQVVGTEAGVTPGLPGLALSDAGYTLGPVATTLPAGEQVPFSFRVTGPDGTPVTRYIRTHEKELHLIVVRRDLAGFQHVHPTRAADGTWTVPLDLTRAGTYRAFADFEPTGLGRGVTLGTDLAVGGSFDPTPLPGPVPTANVAAYEVTLDGAPVAGEETDLTFTLARDGRTVTDLEPYLGAFGHLVSLRVGDLAYLHTHPAEEAHGEDRGGPRVAFATTFPTPGLYRLFLDFRHGGTVRTAEFTVNVTGAKLRAASPSPTGSPANGSAGSDGHGH